MNLDYRDAGSRRDERVHDALSAVLKAVLIAATVIIALLWVAIAVGIVRVLWGLW